ncbi:pyrroline-5-carboxylate reductase [Peptostreptococcus russellii]|uniref:Pyrroline-5-carboxylate reductase n=1 Tax=Peptostreptococcus russellii TaxID=215200 RepID=A0A2P7PYJ8_9FIRM|nr:pyrroline-5-carboxylate reductase [Peptostreptococcus russellii]PSJ30785.1 pyrroline-5-carboxylate reductase [Peptostreptococcus russellii]
MKKLGFIGVGNMGAAMLGGLISSETMAAENIMASARSQSTIDQVSSEYGIKTTLDSKELSRFSDIIILALKPNIIGKVLDDLTETLDSKKLVISVAAGVTIDEIEDRIGDDKKIIRAMPNTPALVGEAMSSLSPNSKVNDEDIELAKKIFNSFGKTQVVEESLIDAVIGVSGSSPAYIFMVIEAMADAAVLSGMPRAQAYEFAAQSVYGAAKMVLETKMHPGELKDMVCSPAGTTIKAVDVLEENGLRGTIIKGQLACVEKSKEMTKKK